MANRAYRVQQERGIRVGDRTLSEAESERVVRELRHELAHQGDLATIEALRKLAQGQGDEVPASTKTRLQSLVLSLVRRH